MPSQTPVVCQVCKRELPPSRCVPAAAVRPALARLILKDRPDWVSTGHICHADLNRFRAQHVQWMLESEKGTLTRLEAASERSSRDDQTVTRKLMEETGEPPTFGQNMADLVARFGGSWRFLILFAGFLVLWISGNAAIALVAHARAFDPYPFILLNLILSCLAAVQAPIIMMSQNRQESRDRQRAENDYKINLKAELEIRNLHEKFDHLLEHQWQFLMEIQQIQVDLLEDLANRKRN